MTSHLSICIHETTNQSLFMKSNCSVNMPTFFLLAYTTFEKDCLTLLNPTVFITATNHLPVYISSSWSYRLHGLLPSEKNKEASVVLDHTSRTKKLHQRLSRDLVVDNDHTSHPKTISKCFQTFMSLTWGESESEMLCCRVDADVVFAWQKICLEY